ncbi:MAG: hypothetical protein E7J43_06880 [Finegoldia magna]|uniref:hypothetical protein n=1 Tax=Finegoldia magna TaxID=1260 RepID=UPI000B915810|nr:hypothetical protein [Finegoldia magna]MBS5967370.1 hypothetical protein [Finegoldia magna]MDU1009886.1 hypothetical protein [Finegoldia magna]MDU1086627.1 hypothetical protein [Finegoldia magna]MDU2544563.1 hypothetical protein [Finegoldia magna]MDU4277795.1 hypothetical protein [Finegoldia magna]
MDKYIASSIEEICNQNKNIMTRFNAKNLFKHNGEFVLSDKYIEFKGYKTIKFDEIEDISLENDDVVSSVNFATQNRMVFGKSARPIRLLLKNGERIYFYVNWNILTGLSSNKKIYDILNDHIKN